MFGYVPTYCGFEREGGYEGGRAMLWSALPMPWTESVEVPRMMATIRKLKLATDSADEKEKQTTTEAQRH